MRYVFKIRHN